MRGEPIAALAATMLVAEPSPAVQYDQALAELHLSQVASALHILLALPTLSSAQVAYRDLALAWQGQAGDLAQLGYLDLTQGYAALALAPLRAALVLAPRYGAGHAWLAWALWTTGDANGAGVEARLAARYAPQADSTGGIAAILAAQGGDAAGAIRRITVWQQQHAPSLALWRVQAEIAMQAGDVAAEREARWQLARTAPPAEQLSEEIALGQFFVRTQLGRDDGRATWLFAQLGAAATHSAPAADLAGQWAWQQAQPAKALALLSQAIALDPSYAPAHRHLAVLAAALGDATTAAIEGDKANGLGVVP